MFKNLLLFVLLICWGTTLATAESETPVPQATTGPISLSAVATVDFEDDNARDGKGGWTDQGKENSLTGFPRGKIEMCGIPFDIPEKGHGALALHGPRRPTLPQQVEVNASGRRGNFLCILAGYAWETPVGSVARIVVNYTDHSEDVLSLDYPQMVSSWRLPKRMEKSTLAWTGKNLMGAEIGLHLATFPLSQPAKEIRSITIAAIPQKGQLFIVGLSVVDTIPPEAVPPAIWKPETTDVSTWFPIAPAADSGSIPVWGVNVSDIPEKSRLQTLNLAASISNPEPQTAAQIIRLTQLLGYNSVELAPLEETIVSSSDGRHTAPDPTKITRLRNFQTSLQKAGIQSILNLGGRRLYECDDGVEAYPLIKRENPIPLFVDTNADALFTETVKEYFNTASSIPAPYANLVFEASLFSFAVTTLPPPQQKMLQNQWNQWLQEKYKSLDAIIAAWSVKNEGSPLQKGENLEKKSIKLLPFFDLLSSSKQDALRACDQIHFFYDTQQSWFHRMVATMRQLGVQAPMSATSYTALPVMRDLQIRLMAGFDVIGVSSPIHQADQQLDDPRLIFYNPPPFQPREGDFFEVAYSRVKDKPFIVTDFALPTPDDKTFLSVLGTSVIGAIQGWDGITHRSLTHVNTPQRMQMTDGSIQENPSLLAILPLTRNIFLRKDVDVAPVLIQRVLQRPGEPQPTDVISVNESILARTMPEGAVIAGGVTALLEGETSIQKPELEKCIFPDHVRSATGQIAWDKKASSMSVQSPRTLALAGNLDGGNATLSDIAAINGKEGLGVLYATSLDGQPLETSKKILLGAVGRSRNKGSFIEQSTFSMPNTPLTYRLTETNEPGMIMEPITGTLTLHTQLKGTWKLTPLNLFGQQSSKESISLSSTKGSLTVPLENNRWKTPLFLLRNE